MPKRLNKTTHGETWIDPESMAYDVPLKRSPRKGLVRWPDKKLRKVLLGVADTYFTIPARGKRNHKTYHGFVHLDSDLEEFVFTPTGSNKGELSWS